MAIPRMRISEGFAPTDPQPCLYEPVHCLVLQGAKCVLIGDQVLHYDAASYFLASIEVPATGRIITASPERPFLALSLTLDPLTLASLSLDLPPPEDDLRAGFAISEVTPELIDPWLRLLRLLDAPQDIPALAPLYEREILYRLLRGPQGGMLRQIASADSRLSQIRRSIAWIRTHYAKPLRVETLAELAGMSASSFHRHFKGVTAMSPLQYQKNVRLQQARRLLLAHPGAAARAAYAVGYESPSQFSREYARLFGAPPSRDAARLRGEASQLEEVIGAA